MNPFIRYFAIAVCVVWPALSFAQNQPTPCGRSHPCPDSCAGSAREGDKPHAEHVRG
jgi:hypothetical protein